MKTLLDAVNQSQQQTKVASSSGLTDFDVEFQSAYESGGQLAIQQIKQAAAAASGIEPDADMSEEEKEKKKIAETKAKMAKDPSFRQHVKEKVGG